YFEGTPIPTSVLLVAVLMGLAGAGRIDDALPFGSVSIRGAGLHPVVLLFALSGTLMVIKTLRIPKP
ncbi:MAG TPA: CDP-diacylglycerol--serine O-phosphatidyltransferase, partial [Actinomycetota bacterium]|nr:CDP-diacylglycerol--serine O-phosphatidyltransferase [Actinomycetota bacterium]